MATIENYFVCVGAQKAGTTWLSKLLSAHPEIFVTPVKEMHFFDQAKGLSNKLSAYKRWSRFRKHAGRLLFGCQDAGQKRRDLRWYMNYLKNPIDDDWYVRLFPENSNYKISGEFTPEYALIGADGYAHIKKLAPKAKILFVLRKPSEQAWSQYLHFRDRHGAEIDADDAIRFWKTDYSVKLRDYARTIRQLHDAFGASNVHIVFYEDLSEDTPESLNKIYRFLGVSSFALPAGSMKTVYNKSPDVEISRELADYLDRECLGITEAVAEIVGHVPAAWTDRPSSTELNAMSDEPQSKQPGGALSRERPH